MNSLMGKLKRTSEYVAMVLLFVASFFTLLFYIGGFGNDFMPVIGNLLSMILAIAIWMIVPLCIILKRRSYARWGALSVGLYWLITSLFSLLDRTGLASEGFTDLAISVGVFSFLTACALIVMTSVALTAVIRKDSKLKMRALFIYCGTLVFYIVLFALSVAVSAKWNDGWTAYFEHLCNYIVLPFAMGFVAIAFGFKEEEFLCPWGKKPAVSAEEKSFFSAAPVEHAEEPKSEPAFELVEEPEQEIPAEEPEQEIPAEEPVREVKERKDLFDYAEEDPKGEGTGDN